MQKIYLLIYKILGFIFLFSMIIGIVIYGGMLGFYSISTSWAAPVILSPTQERVLSFQPQMLNLEATLDKAKIDLATSKMTISALTSQLDILNNIIARSMKSQKFEANSAIEFSESISKTVKSKQSDVDSTTNMLEDINKLADQIDKELETKLITKDEASRRKIALQELKNSITDSRTQLIQSQILNQQLINLSSTLSGGASSVTGMVTIKQFAELQSLSTQLKIQIETNKASVLAYERNIAEVTRVLNTAKLSPYYSALTVPTPVLFVPYDNISDIVGKPIYDCLLQVIICRQVGTVEKINEAEEYARHPIFRTDIRGRFVSIQLIDREAAKSDIVFIGRKPLFF